MYCENSILFNSDITLIKEGECNNLKILVPMEKMKMMHSANLSDWEQDVTIENDSDENYMLEIGCEIKSIEQILISKNSV